MISSVTRSSLSLRHCVWNSLRGGSSASCARSSLEPRCRVVLSQQTRLNSSSSGNGKQTNNKNGILSTTTSETAQQQQQSQPGATTTTSSAASSSSSYPQQRQQRRQSPYYYAIPASSGIKFQQQSWEPVYVHPLSQMVLLYFQTPHGRDWITRKGLQRLQIHRDGSFLLSCSSSASNNGSSSSSSIWTCYEEVEKKHWLYYSQKDVRYPFLLKDTNLPAPTCTSSRSTYSKHRHDSEQVEQSVRDLIQAVEELEDESTD